jgi:hypothetical protein
MLPFHRDYHCGISIPSEKDTEAMDWYGLVAFPGVDSRFHS